MSRFRGQFEAILASLSFGTAPIFAKKGFLSGLHPLSGIAIAILTGLLVNIVFVFSTGEWKKLVLSKRQGFLFALIAGGCNTVAVVTYFWAMAIGKVALVVPITCIYPLFTVVAVFAFLRKSETLDTWTVIGTILIIVGIILTV
jgi:bacterial/archaeal transporter family protein